MLRINSIRHGERPARWWLSRLAVPTSLVTVGSVLALGAATAHADHDYSIAGSANAAEHRLGAESTTRPARAPDAANAAEHSQAGGVVADDSRNPAVIHLSAPAGTGTTRVDVGAPGQSVGDYLVFNHPVLNPAMTQKQGDLRGQCVFVEDTICMGDVTFELASGLITVEGPFHLTREANSFAITGGTGAYQTAQGVLEVRSTTERNDFVLRLLR
ncbi:allene oxide cyclase barrel-like domain-containing protein [Terrabacter sp. 2YAF2]|uniref:allene oxide cyclase barrel-like domain-containing protein n=1 Tax=Terrabacter sp. 2YAF2 TaxID=3233026 RepID=UPI003F969A4E